MNDLFYALRAAYPGRKIGPDLIQSECVLGPRGIEGWNRPEPQPDEAALLASYDPITDVKASSIADINAECTRRILAKWPIEKQSSCWAGVYPTAVAQQCADDIAAMIAASNTACDAIEAATTIEEVEAVTVAWPAI